MVRLIRERYFAYDSVRGCDLVTGEEVSLEGRDSQEPVEEGRDLGPFNEALDQGRDGRTQWIVAEATDHAEALAVTRRMSRDGRRRGFGAIAVQLYFRFRDVLQEEWPDRSLLLIGGWGEAPGTACHALLDAAARAPRPHVLVTFRVSRLPEPRPIAREARATYGVATGARPAAAPVSFEVARQAARVRKAGDLGREGRHAAAERLLRDAGAALRRRGAWLPAAEAMLALGRLLLERGRALESDSLFDESARLAQSCDEAAMIAARLWQAAARTDAGRFTEAESICRSVLLAGRLSPAWQSWAHAALARVLLWQQRTVEVSRMTIGAIDLGESSLDPATRAFVHSVAVRVSLSTGNMFEAGYRARYAVEDADASDSAAAKAIAYTAHLRVLAATGDLTLARGMMLRVQTVCREARSPLRLLRARLLWHDALHRAGRGAEVVVEREYLSRVQKAAPASLRRLIANRLAKSETRALLVPTSVSTHAPRLATLAVSLVRETQDEDDDPRAVRQVIEQVGRELLASRMDLLSCDAGPVSTLMTCGAGLATHVGSRVVEAGIVVGPEKHTEGQELGVPVRLGARLLGAIVARWPMGVAAGPEARDVLELGAALAAPRVEAMLIKARLTVAASTSVPNLVGVSSVLVEVRRAIARAAGTPFAVLIEGESGVGKELVARAIHGLSARRERRFCDVNCAALPEELLESELFGHARGAFTGALTDRAGLFEEAHGGTLFLDEVADLSPRAQAKLLRVLQQQDVRRVGESFSRPVDVRVVAAANRDLRTAAAAGRFRGDLLYRLDVIRVCLPPLRERPEDIPVLAEHLWRDVAARVGSTAVLTHGVLAALCRYAWPGNVREMQNVLAALAVAAPARGRVRESQLPAAITGATAVTARRLAEARTEFERKCVEVALARAQGNRTRAAAALGLSRQGLLKTMTRLGLDTGTAESAARPGEAHSVV